jgi:cleavage and polyadenylation specificity factor subunit 2
MRRPARFLARLDRHPIYRRSDRRPVAQLASDQQPNQRDLSASRRGDDYNRRADSELLDLAQRIVDDGCSGEMVQGKSYTKAAISIRADGVMYMTQFEDYEVAKVTGRVHVGANMSIPVLELPIKDEGDAIAEASSAVKREERMDVDSETKPTERATMLGTETISSTLIRNAPATLPQTLFIGDLRLNSLKARLSGMSIPAEFAGEGMLICGPGVPTLLRGEKLGPGMGSSVVAIRKTSEGRIEMEGSVGDVYYHVRDALYGNFAQVVM